MTREQLLAATRPEDLFPGDLDQAKHLHRQYARAWHPDLPTGDGAVWTHIADLYTLAVKRLTNGTWEGPTTVTFSGTSFHAHANTPFALGRTVVGDLRVVYVLDPAHRPLFDAASTVERQFTYASDRMKADIARYLPRVLAKDTSDERLVLHVAKTTDLIRLSDVQRHLGGAIDPRHVAWIVSSLMNLTCYLSFANIVHHDISPDTVFVSPEFHSVALLGGWWHWRKRGAAVWTVPARTASVLPFKVKTKKTASALTDAECVRLTGRELLGARTTPAAMRAWLAAVATGTALEQYTEWMRVLEDSFGPRRFVPLSVTADAVYTRNEVTHGGR